MSFGADAASSFNYICLFLLFPLDGNVDINKPLNRLNVYEKTPLGLLDP